MSIYKACSQACRELAAKGEPFIDIDVVNAAAASDGQGWSNRNFRDAARQANQIVGTEYRNGRLVRYGPVGYDGGKDYVRKAGRVLYADAQSGPETITTPNGVFGQMRDRVNDDLAKVGRRRGAMRDDFRPWGEQTPESIRDDGMMVDGRPLHREIERLRADLKAANKRNEEIQRELDRVRETKAGEIDLPVSPEAVRKMMEEIAMEFLGDLDGRIKSLEDREQRRSELYADAA